MDSTEEQWTEEKEATTGKKQPERWVEPIKRGWSHQHQEEGSNTADVTETSNTLRTLVTVVENGCVQTWILPYVTAQGQLKGWGQSQDAPKCLVASLQGHQPYLLPFWFRVSDVFTACSGTVSLPQGFLDTPESAAFLAPSFLGVFFFFSCLVLSREEECLGICNVLFQRRAVWCQSRTKNQEIRDQRP